MNGRKNFQFPHCDQWTDNVVKLLNHKDKLYFFTYFQASKIPSKEIFENKPNTVSDIPVETFKSRTEALLHSKTRRKKKKRDLAPIQDQANATGMCCTVWKFNEFPTTQILREVKVGESRISES